MKSEIIVKKIKWKSKELSEICEIFSGGTPSTKNEEYWNGDIPWLSSGETRNNFIVETERKITLSGVKNSSTRLAKKNDVVVASAGQGNTRGQVSLCLIDTYVNQSIIVLRTNNEIILPKFLFYNLKSRYMELRKVSDAHSSRGSLPKNVLSTVKISFPSLSKQEKIGKILYDLDIKIQNLQNQNQILEKIIQTIFKSWFVDFDGHTEFDESELGQIPKGWKVKTLNEIIDKIIDHRGKTPKKLETDWVEKGIPVISAKNIKNGKIINQQQIRFVDKETYEKWMPEKIQEGDIILTSEGPLGELYYVKHITTFCTGQRLFAIRVNHKEINSGFLYFYLNSDRGRNQLFSRATGSTVLGIRQSELREIKVLIPNPKSLQNFSIISNSFLSLFSNNQERLEKLFSIRNSLLPKLMSGEIQV